MRAVEIVPGTGPSFFSSSSHARIASGLPVADLPFLSPKFIFSEQERIDVSLRERLGVESVSSTARGVVRTARGCNGPAWSKSSADCIGSPATWTDGPRSAAAFVTRRRRRRFSGGRRLGWRQPGIIHRRLDRRSTVSRAAAGRAVDEQVVAANVDTIFLVTALIQDLNPRRIERYLTMVWDAGAVPVVVLNKADLCEDPAAAAAVARARLPLVDVSSSARCESGGLGALEPYLRPAQTWRCSGRRASASRRWSTGCSAARRSGSPRPARRTARVGIRRPRGSWWSCREARC